MNTGSKSEHIQARRRGVDPWFECTRAPLAVQLLDRHHHHHHHHRHPPVGSGRHRQSVFPLGVSPWERNKAFHLSEA